MTITESEKVIRILYEITTEHQRGFEYQVLRLLRLGCERFNLDIGILAKVDGNVYKVMHKVCPPDIPLQDGAEFDLGQTYCAVTMSAKGPVAFEHVKQSKWKTHPAYKQFALESYIGTSIKVNEKTYGTLNFSSPNPLRRKFKKADIDALQLMAAWLSAELLRIENEIRLKEANQKLEALATTDNLTNLYNRRAFQDNLEHQLHLAKRTEEPVSLLLIDVDNFKPYNDSFGHLKGDQVLKDFAETLLKNSRSSDFVTRFGGDEFAILLPNTDKMGALVFGEILRNEIQKKHWPERKMTASLGISTIHFSRNEEMTMDVLCTEVLNEADKALYYSKNNGRNQLTHFSELKKRQKASNKMPG